MSMIADILTIARWEVKKSFTMMSRNVLPVAIILLVLLVIVTGFAAQSGMHIQDGMYEIGVDDPQVAALIASDVRFSVYNLDVPSLIRNRDAFDFIIVQGWVYPGTSEKSKAAVKTLERDYAKYKNQVYNGEEDLFAAYPLWIDVVAVKSELNFLATQSGQYVQAAPGSGTPVPEGEVSHIPTPSPTLAFSKEEIREELVRTNAKNTQISRYTEVLSTSSGNAMGSFKTPSQLSPPLPFDSIILVFVFIFPLYFTSQFFMMSIMNERIERKGEVLLSTPIRTSALLIGKALPYATGMLLICAGLTLYLRAPLIILLPLIPIIFFFLANALIIGMVARSFKELSFISIFFSTIATSYLFFPSIFANVHVVSLISPLTLIVLTLQGSVWTATDYLYSTSLFWLTGAVLIYIAACNFKEERLFSEKRLLPRIREFLSETLSRRHPYLSLFSLTALSIPFVFMVQLMSLVLFFNLPMPYSLVLLLVFAAFIEELAKAMGLYALFATNPAFFSWKNLIIACAVTAAGFLVAEKLLLFVTLAQITESIFGSILFLSLGVIWMPFLLHFGCILIVGCSLKLWGQRGLAAGLILATLAHCLYNSYFIQGWLT